MEINNIEYLPGLNGYGIKGLVGADGSDGNTIYYVNEDLDSSTNHPIYRSMSNSKDLVLSGNGCIYNKSKQKIGSTLNYELNLDDYIIDKHVYIPRIDKESGEMVQDSSMYIKFNINKSECVKEDGVIYELRNMYTNEIKTILGYEQ